MRSLPPRRLRSWFDRTVVLLGLGSCAHATDLDFYRDVYPFLKANCIACHNKTTTKADLDMETPEAMQKGGESGPAVIAGKGEESLIVQAARHTEELVMPPKGNKSGARNLAPAEVEVLKTWIDQGANHSVPQERSVAWQPLAPGVHPIYSVAMTKDGRWAACGRSNQIALYDLATRQFSMQLADPALPPGSAHRALVQSLAFSPDGTRLASGSFRELKIWRQEGGQSATLPADPALAVVLSVLTADGQQVVSADQAGSLVIRDTKTGGTVKKIADVSKSGIKLLSLTSDGSKALVYGLDATLSLWNLQEGKSLASNAGIMGLSAATWTSDGISIVTASEDKKLRIWSPPPDGMMEFPAPRELATVATNIISLVAGSVADQVLSGCQDGKVQVWSLAESKVVHEINSPGLLCIGLSKDGNQLVTGAADGALRLWNVAGGNQIMELRGSLDASRKIAALEWTIAAQALDQEFQNAEIARITVQNAALDELSKKADDAIVAMNGALPEKQKTLQTAREAKAASHKAVEDVGALIAKAPEGKPDAALIQQQKDTDAKLVESVTAETSAAAAVSAAENNVQDAEIELKRITDTKTANMADLAAKNVALESSKKVQETTTADLAAARQALNNAAAKPMAVGISNDGQQVAATFSDGTLRTWAVVTGAATAQTSTAATTAATLMQTSEGTFISSHADGTIAKLASAPRWVLERTIGGESDRSFFPDRVNSVCFSPDGKSLATGGGEPSRSGDISLFEVESGKLLTTWNGAHKDVVLSLDYSPDGTLLASGSADRIARVTTVATGKVVNLFEAHTHYVLGVAFRADGRVLASAGADGVVNVWDMILGERKKKIEGWTKEVTSLHFIGATNQIVTSAGDNQIRIVNDAGAEIRSIAKLPDFMQSTATTPTASTVIGGGEDSVLRVWDGTNGKELAVFGL